MRPRQFRADFFYAIVAALFVAACLVHDVKPAGCCSVPCPQTEQQLVQQLDAALQSGSWMVYSEGDEGVRPGNNKGCFADLDQFLAHVQKEYLVGTC
jgi:hypothetical protein